LPGVELGIDEDDVAGVHRDRAHDVQTGVGLVDRAVEAALLEHVADDLACGARLVDDENPRLLIEAAEGLEQILDVALVERLQHHLIGVDERRDLAPAGHELVGDEHEEAPVPSHGGPAPHLAAVEFGQTPIDEGDVDGALAQKALGRRPIRRLDDRDAAVDAAQLALSERRSSSTPSATRMLTVGAALGASLGKVRISELIDLPRIRGASAQAARSSGSRRWRRVPHQP